MKRVSSAPPDTRQANAKVWRRELEVVHAMFITKKHISRRTVLKGAGVAVSLPFLNAMVPAMTAIAATAAAPKPRLGFFYFPHGAIMEKWTPATNGRDFEMSPILEPLKPFKNQLTVFEQHRQQAG